MTQPAPDGEFLDDFVARISDVLRFVFAQQRDDVVVLVGEPESNREFLSQLQAASPVAEAEAMDDIGGVSTRTHVRSGSSTTVGTSSTTRGNADAGASGVVVYPDGAKRHPGLSRHPGFRCAQSGLRIVIYSRRGPRA
jgi:hypothetical protein